MSKFLSGRQSNLKLGVAGYTENQTVLETTGRVGIGTNNAQHYSLFVVGPTNIDGSLNVSGIATFAQDVDINGELTVLELNVTGGATIGTDITARHLNLTGIATVAGNADINGNLDVDGTTELDGLNVDGITTLDQTTVDGLLTVSGNIDANGGITATQATVEDLTDNRIVLAGTGGRLEDSANLTYDGNQLNVVGHTELDDVNVSGIATVTSLNVSTNFDVYDSVATIHNDLYVGGNLSIGGTTTVIQAQDLRIFDKDIILGVTTDAYGNDISTDITANHAGVAVASTTGFPLVDLTIAGLEELPATYKKIMWFREGTFSGLGTDAWLFNYAVGIGSTQFPSGTRLAAGQIQITEDTVNTPNLSVSGVSTFAGLVNVDGGITANTAIVEDLTDNRIVLAGPGGELEDDANLTFDGTTLGVGVNLDVDGTTELDGLNVDGTTTLDNTTVEGTLTVNGDIDLNGGIDVDGQSELDNLNVSGVSTFVGVGTFQSDLYVGSNLYVQGDINLDEITARNINITGVSTFVSVDINGNLDVDGSTELDSLNVDGHTELDQLRVSGVSTFVGDTTFQSNVYLGDNDKVVFGDGNDLQIYHNSNNGNSIIQETGNGNLIIAGNNVHIRNATASENYAKFTQNGAVKLYYNNVQKFETTSYGVKIYDDLNVGTGVTIYGNAGIVSATSFYGDGSNLTNTGATLSATSGVERLVTTQLTSGTMVDAATDADLTFDATTNTLNTLNLKVSGGISTDGSNYGQQFELLRSKGNGEWEWASVPGIFSVNNILNGFNVLEEGTTVGTAGSIHTLDFRGNNITAIANPAPNGIATVTVSDTPTFDSLTVTGESTLGVTEVTNLTSQQLNISGLSTFVGVATFQSNIFIDGDLNIAGSVAYGAISGGNLKITGISTFDGLLDANGGIEANTVKVEDLTDNRVVIAGTGGELEDDANLTFDGSQLSVGVNLDVDGHTELDNVNVSAAATFASNVDITTGNLYVGGNLTVDGTQTFLNTSQLEVEDINIGIASASSRLSDAQLDGAGITIYGSAGDKTLSWSNADSRMEFNTNLYAPNFFVGGITASGDVDIDGHTELDQLRVSGVSTFQGNVDLGDNDRLRFGDGNDLQIYHDGNNSYIEDTGTGRLIIRGSSNVDIRDTLGNTHARFKEGTSNNSRVELYYDNSKKFETIGYGVTIYNDLTVGTGVTIYGNAGIVSATKLYGDGSDLTGINAGAILGASSGTQRLVMTGLTSGAMLNAATDADLRYNSVTDTLITENLNVVGLSTFVGVGTFYDDLYVYGNLNVTGDILYDEISGRNLNISGIATFGGQISAGGTTGTDGQYLKSTGVGVTWADFPTLRTTHTENANAGITTFNFTYNVNFLDVFINGVKLTPTEYTASNGSTVTLATPTFQDDIVELVSYNTVSSYAGAGSSTGISDGDKGDIIVSGSGTNWQIDANTIGPNELVNTSVTPGTYNFATLTVDADGRLTAASSGTETPESFTAVGIQSGGSLVGSAQTINFANNLTATVSNGVATIDSLGGGGGASVEVSDTAPSNPSEGDLWWRSTDGKGFIYYNDGNSNQWVEFNPSAVGIAGISTSGTSTFNVISANTYQGITTSMISDYGNGLSGGGGSSYTNSDVDAHLNVSGATSGQILSWNGSDYAWVTDQTASGGSGISLTDLSVTQNSAGTAALSYNNSNGVFSYTPPDLSNYLTITGDGSQLTGIGTVAISDNAPSNPSVGDLWWESDTASGFIYYNDGNSSQWVEFNPTGSAGPANATISDNAPSSPTHGDLWWESDTATGHIYYNDGNSAQWVQFNSGSSGGSGSSGIGTSRFSVSNTTGSIGAGTTADITITGAKAYSLFKIETSHAAWVRLYTDTTSRTNDASRAYTTDPTPGSGVLAEVYTTSSGSNTFKMTPAVTGWNDDATPSTNIYAKVTNNESTSQDITVTLTILRMED